MPETTRKLGRTRRGPSKAGRKALVMHFTDEELALLSYVSELACRSMAQHARFLVLEALKLEAMKKEAESGSV